MANPNPELRGYADPSTPGWQRRAFERVKARQRGSVRHTERQDSVRTVWDIPFRVLLDEAAKRRGLSMSGYCRRAIAAFVAHDLGLPPSETGKYMPVPTPYRSKHGMGNRVKSKDDLKGYGKWVIRELDEA